mgnify:CR=1 FL=1
MIRVRLLKAKECSKLVKSGIFLVGDGFVEQDV